MNIESAVKKITTEIRKHVDTAVVGLSGGADSTLVMLLSAEALGRKNVYAISMPYSEIDIKTFNRVSSLCAEHVGVHHLIAEIGRIADAVNQTISEIIGYADTMSTLNTGNARSRARMSVLYGYAHHLNEKLKNRVRVMGTGNMSEDFIGYDTKGGDALADIFPIGHLFKSEVYLMLEYFRDKGKITEEMINRIPSAGLWENQTDEAELGYSYNEMEPAILYLLDNYDHIDQTELSDIQRFVWERHVNNRHKHEASFVIRLRDDKGNLCL